jgi:hypothetical protein
MLFTDFKVVLMLDLIELLEGFKIKDGGSSLGVSEH